MSVFAPGEESPAPKQPEEQHNAEQSAQPKQAEQPTAYANKVRQQYELKLYATIRNAIKTNNCLDVLESVNQFVVPFGSAESARSGHEGTRAFDTFDYAADTQAAITAMPVWQINILRRAKVAPVIVDRSELGLSTIILAKDLPSEIVQVQNTSAWKKRIRFIKVHAPHTSESPRTLDLNLNPLYRIFGPKGKMIDTLTKLKVHLTSVKNFKNGPTETIRGIAPLSASDVETLTKSGLLVCPDEALTTSKVSDRMLVIDFKFGTNPQVIIDYLAKIQRDQKCFANVTSFKGRLLFATTPDADTVNKFQHDIVRFCQRQQGNVTGVSENNIQLPQLAPTPEMLLLTGLKGVLCEAHVTAIINAITSKTSSHVTILSKNDRSALLKMKPEAAAQFDSCIINGLVACSLFTKVTAARDAAELEFKASMERHKDHA